MGRGILRGAGGDENLKFNFIWPYVMREKIAPIKIVIAYYNSCMGYLNLWYNRREGYSFIETCIIRQAVGENRQDVRLYCAKNVEKCSNDNENQLWITK